MGGTIRRGSPGLATLHLAEDSLGRAETRALCQVRFLPAAVGGEGEGVFFFPPESKGGERAVGRKKGLERSLGWAHPENHTPGLALGGWEWGWREGEFGGSQHPPHPCILQKRRQPPRRALDVAFKAPPTASAPLPLVTQPTLLPPHLCSGCSLCLGCPSHPGPRGSGLPSPWTSRAGVGVPGASPRLKHPKSVMLTLPFPKHGYSVSCGLSAFSLILHKIVIRGELPRGPRAALAQHPNKCLTLLSALGV